MNHDKISALVEALPYILKFHGKKVLVKFGGSAMLTDEGLEMFAQDVVVLQKMGMKPIVVHGGGPEINRAMERMGKKARKVNGLRVTDSETLEIAEMVLVGKINSGLVSRIQKHGGKAVGISGKADGMLLSTRLEPVATRGSDGKQTMVDLGHVGEVTRVNSRLVDLLCDNGFIPVLSPIGSDSEGNSLNLNADTAAAVMASAVGAEKLVLMTDVPGVLRRPGDLTSVISHLKVSEIDQMIEEGTISGGMIPKIQAARDSLDAGVGSVHILDGKLEHSLLVEIFTDEGIGTMIIDDRQSQGAGQPAEAAVRLENDPQAPVADTPSGKVQT
jgi:acetylglutamate kinase